MKRAASSAWPQVFLPERGCRPLAVNPRRDERVLHVCLKVPGDPQTALGNALRGISADYAEVDWFPLHCQGRSVTDAVCAVARLQRPTLVFIQVQTPNVLTSGDIASLRPLCAPGAVIVQWDGDRRTGPQSPEKAWLVELGRALDASLVVCTADAAAFAEMGIRSGYLQIGVDADIWQPTTPDPRGPAIVLLASSNKHLGYSTRISAAEMLSYRFPTAFRVYGRGWEFSKMVKSHDHVPHEREAPLYSKALAAISISIRNDLPRYTSDRLFRCLASGALTLVESFPDMEGLGLVNGVNCLAWDGLPDLEAVVGNVLQYSLVDERSLIRASARDLALTHTWDARMHELYAIVEQLRSTRAAA